MVFLLFDVDPPVFKINGLVNISRSGVNSGRTDLVDLKLTNGLTRWTSVVLIQPQFGKYTERKITKMHNVRSSPSKEFVPIPNNIKLEIEGSGSD